jgi:hypothetical protein
MIYETRATLPHFRCDARLMAPSTLATLSLNALRLFLAIEFTMSTFAKRECYISSKGLRFRTSLDSDEMLVALEELSNAQLMEYLPRMSGALYRTPDRKPFPKIEIACAEDTQVMPAA